MRTTSLEYRTGYKTGHIAGRRLWQNRMKSLGKHMKTEQLKTALVLAEQRDQLQQRIADLDAKIQAALNGQAPTPQFGPNDKTSPVIVEYLRKHPQARLVELAGAVGTTKGSITQWLIKNKTLVRKVDRGVWALK